MNLKEYQAAFSAVEADYEAAIRGFGLDFEETESAPRSLRVQTACALGCRLENGEGSMGSGWLSPACVACRKGERTLTFFVDLRCTKHCYFCFNPNQDYFDYFQTHKRNIVAELEDAYAHGAEFDVLAVTGGEPMLYKDMVVSFFAKAKELYPEAHTRLYTSGDCLDEAGVEELAAAGLTEIRFSVKPEDADGRGVAASVTHTANELYALMTFAKQVGLDVVIEVPVIPGTAAAMQEMLVRADAAGVDGINLLEFCFPLHNAEEFARRGFKLRKRPFAYLYNYWYGGGIPVAESEALALELLGFAKERGLRLGLHYCSSDNKNTGQIYQQNLPLVTDSVVRARYPWLEMDPEGFYLVCAKAFGPDALKVARKLDGRGVAYSLDKEAGYVAFPLVRVEEIRRAFPGLELGKSINVLEETEADPHYLRELDLIDLPAEEE